MVVLPTPPFMFEMATTVAGISASERFALSADDAAPRASHFYGFFYLLQRDPRYRKICGRAIQREMEEDGRISGNRARQMIVRPQRYNGFFDVVVNTQHGRHAAGGAQHLHPP